MHPSAAGLAKLAVIVLIFLALAIVSFMLNTRRFIMDNWAKYQCNPLIIPFAEFFGRDSMQTNEECMLKTYTSAHASSLPPFLDIMDSMSGTMSSAGEMMTEMDYVLGGVQNMFSDGFGKVLSQIGNTTAVAQYLITKMEVLLQRLSATLIVVMYTLNASLQGVLAVRRDKSLLNAVDTLLKFPSF